MSNPLLALLASYHPIPPADQERISAVLEYRFYREGEVLFAPHHICRQLFFVVSGIIRVIIIQDDGQVAVPFFIRENKLCTILHSFTNQAVGNEGIEAACDAEVILFNRDDLYALYKDIPYLQELITHITQQMLMEKIAVRNAFMGMDAATRYRHFIDLQGDIAARVSLGDIASYLGITPQSLSRIRKSLR